MTVYSCACSIQVHYYTFRRANDPDWRLILVITRLTSLTDALSFFIGALTPIPFCTIFCLYAGTNHSPGRYMISCCNYFTIEFWWPFTRISREYWPDFYMSYYYCQLICSVLFLASVQGTGMLVLYAFQVSLFGATLAVYARLEAQNRHGLFCCVLPKRDDNGSYPPTFTVNVKKYLPTKGCWKILVEHFSIKWPALHCSHSTWRKCRFWLLTGTQAFDRSKAEILPMPGIFHCYLVVSSLVE